MAIQNNGKTSLKQRWDDYRPTKSALAWACAGAAIATMVIGFTFGGWVTGGASRDLASTAGTSARSELAANICVERFQAAPDSAARQAELQAIASASARRQFVEAGGWATMPGDARPDRRGAEGCAVALAA